MATYNQWHICLLSTAITAFCHILYSPLIFFSAETGPSSQNSISVLEYFSTYGYQNLSCCTCEPMVTEGDRDREWEGLKSIALQRRVFQISIHPNVSQKFWLSLDKLILCRTGAREGRPMISEGWGGGKLSFWRHSPPMRVDYGSGWTLNWHYNALLEALKKKPDY